MSSLPHSMATGQLNILFRKSPDNAMVITLAYLARSVEGEPDGKIRPVAFDEQRRRYTLKLDDCGWSTSVSAPEFLLVHGEHRLDSGVLPFDHVKWLGIEVVPAEVRRAEEIKASECAIQEARDAAIEILPRPEIDRPFSFSLTDTQGRALRSSDLKGKVVLIDCWASWSGPCTERLPRLKARYERRRGEGFEVIGLNFDTDRGRAERVVQALALPWPQIFVPADDRTRRLWREGPGFPT